MEESCGNVQLGWNRACRLPPFLLKWPFGRLTQ
jgi:hypothetical protein